ncbi:hypothetical protein BFJ63_vAg8799 [Fusarium oxysporum f. sp. narcissi]|uniref:PNPLA domain-containing protein n=1 Tax=Fusarium oxysporum f. sp. narcissi TaxID=451672 RepID=A0A4Q2VPU0_FUSOX|nr:hypothetical protein BFJ63_vAg8799 [Fusarium oxysporum f. sp. narcissi]
MAVSSCVKDDVEFEHIWRSYEVPARVSLNSNEAHTSKTTNIWQVALATFAHPLYFDPIEISGYKFLDGGLAASNPSYIALREILSLHSKAPAAFINLGTGLNRPVSSDYIGIGTITNHGASRASLLRSSPHFPRTLTEWHFTNTEWETQQWLEQAARIGLEQAYRLDAEGDLYKIPFDDWCPTGTGQKTIQKITEITNHYLDTDTARDTIDRIANKAVRIRRSRTHTERWEAFAIDLDYTCVLCLRPTLKPHCKYRADLRAHLEKRHADWHMTDEEIEKYLDAGRRYSGEDPLATE